MSKFIFLILISLFCNQSSFGDQRTVGRNIPNHSNGTVLINNSGNIMMRNNLIDSDAQCDPNSAWSQASYINGRPVAPGDSEAEVVQECTCKNLYPGENSFRRYRLENAASNQNTCPKPDNEKCVANSHFVVTGNIQRCICNYPEVAGQEAIGYAYDPSLTNGIHENLCPAKPPDALAAANGENFACIQDISRQIEDCAKAAEETGKSCSDKSQKTRDMQNTINGTSAQISAALGNSGSVESCSKAGLLSSTAGYGAGMLATDCKEEIVSCKNACGNLLKYADENAIISHCSQNNGSATLSTLASNAQNLENFKERAKELSNLMASAEDTCASNNKPTTAQTFLNNSINSATRFAELSQTSARCTNALSGKVSAIPLTLACAMGTGVNCPVNCVNNPGDVSCKTVSGTASQLASIASKNSQYIPSGFGTGKVPAGSIDLGNLDLGDDSGVAGTTPVADSESATMFSSAAQANAGGGGSTAASDSKNKAGSGAESTEDKGFFGGTFSAMKNAVNRAIGGSSFFGGKNTATSSSSKIDVSKKKSLVRGLAHTGGATCYMDAKGSEFCFGRKNMDIFQMMNKQYTNQNRNNTFFAN